MKDDKKGLVVAVAVIAIVSTVTISPWAATQVWNMTAVPILHAPPLSFVDALLLMTAIGFFFNEAIPEPESKPGESKSGIAARLLSRSVVSPLSYALFVWVVATYFR